MHLSNLWGNVLPLSTKLLNMRVSQICRSVFTCSIIYMHLAAAANTSVEANTLAGQAPRKAGTAAWAVDQRSLEELEVLARTGDAAANYTLGIRYSKGLGVSPDPIKAFARMRSAATQGHLDGQIAVGLYYLSGTGTKASPRDAVKWLTSAATRGNIEAQGILAEMYGLGTGIAKNRKEAIKWALAAAKQGDPESQYNLAVLYSQDERKTANHAEAVKWYKAAANQGHLDAQIQVAIAYLEGHGVTPDFDEAYRWLKPLAKQGNPWAQTRLGFMYQNGKVPGQSAASSREEFCFYRAAKQGNAEAAVEFRRFASRNPRFAEAIAAASISTPNNTMTQGEWAMPQLATCE